MRQDHQKTLFEIIKRKTQGQDSLGNVVGDILNISSDAVYRRYRGETHLTIFELETLCKHFDISLDTVFGMGKNRVMFEFQPLENYDFSMKSYLQNLLNGMHQISALKHPQLLVSINNTPLIHLLNFPHLLRFKLFFWAKTHLEVPEYANEKFKYEKIAEDVFQIGKETLRLYNSVPSKELFDPELLKGFIREIYYYYTAQLFEEPQYAVKLLDELSNFLSHLKAQAEVGKKFIYGTHTPASGNDFEMYYNETLNSITSILYSSDEFEGLFIAHNFLNSLHTIDQQYIEESKRILLKQISHSSMISAVNEKERNHYFHQIEKSIQQFKMRIELDMEV